VRLLTLTGAGGTGKTRLALQVASELVDEFVDGAYFVALASIRDPALVLSAIAGTLGVRETGENSLVESLRFVLRDKGLLLVLDNFEHLVEAASAVSELLIAAPRLVLLVTSRAPLHVYAEHEYAVLPMEVPHLWSLPSLERLVGV
jgi:predicted ATPase